MYTFFSDKLIYVSIYSHHDGKSSNFSASVRMLVCISVSESVSICLFVYFFYYTFLIHMNMNFFFIQMKSKTKDDTRYCLQNTIVAIQAMSLCLWFQSLIYPQTAIEALNNGRHRINY